MMASTDIRFTGKSLSTIINAVFKTRDIRQPGETASNYSRTEILVADARVRVQ